MAQYYRRPTEGHEFYTPQVWHINKRVYRTDYYKMIANRKEALPANLLDLLSTPEAIALTDSYVGQTNRVLVVGQETYGNYSPLSSATEFSAWSAQLGGYIAFDFAYEEGATGTSKFWKAFDEIAQYFELPDRRALAWSNLCKVQLLEPIKGSFSIRNLPAEMQMKIIKWQHLTMFSELEFIDPDAIVFLTGSMSWILRETFGAEITEDPAGFNKVNIPGIPIPMVQIAHPNARHETATARANALAYLKPAVEQERRETEERYASVAT